MRVVVDTNVFISAVLKDKSVPAIAVRLALLRGVLLKSLATEQQLLEVITRPYLADFIMPEARAWLREILARAESVSIQEKVTACRDTTDDKFLEVAVNGRADMIVSGDADLLALDPFRDIPIITPAEFVRRASKTQ